MTGGISPTLLMNETILSKKKKGEEVYAFGFGMSPFPVPEILSTSLSQKSVLGMYLPSAGLTALRHKIAAHHSSLGVQSFDENQVVVSPGSKEMIFQIQMACRLPLILPSPSWVSYGPQAKMLNLGLHWIDTQCENEYKMTANDLKDYIVKNNIERSLLILNYPNNPTGVTYTNQELQSIAKVCKEHGIIVISDEIYGLLNYEGTYHSISNFLPDQTIITSGLSKWCNAGGYRLGYGIFPDEMDEIRQKVIIQASETYSCVAAPIQYAAVEIFEAWSDMMHLIKKQRKVLQFVSNYIISNLRRLQIQCSSSDGGFYTFIDLSSHRTHLAKKGIYGSDEMCQTLITEYGLALLPGTVFGRPMTEYSARLAFVDFNGKYALEHVSDYQNSTHFVENICPKIYHSINQFENFLTY